MRMRTLHRRQLELGPGAHGHLQVGEVGSERLDHRPEPEMAVGRQPGPGRREVVDHLDADRRAPEPRFDDVGPLERRRISARARAAPVAGPAARPRPPPLRRPACPCRWPPRPPSGRRRGWRRDRGPPGACRPRPGHRGSRPEPRRTSTAFPRPVAAGSAKPPSGPVVNCNLTAPAARHRGTPPPPDPGRPRTSRRSSTRRGTGPSAPGRRSDRSGPGPPAGPSARSRRARVTGLRR